MYHYNGDGFSEQQGGVVYRYEVTLWYIRCCQYTNMRWHCAKAQCDNTNADYCYFHMDILYVDIFHYKYLDYITWWMYILSHFGRSYCVFQILIQMTVRPHIINTPGIIFMVHTI